MNKFFTFFSKTELSDRAAIHQKEQWLQEDSIELSKISFKSLFLKKVMQHHETSIDQMQDVKKQYNERKFSQEKYIVFEFTCLEIYPDLIYKTNKKQEFL